MMNGKGANVGTNLLRHSFCGDFGYKVPLVYRNCPSQARGNSDKPRELYSRSPLRMSDLVDKSAKNWPKSLKIANLCS